MTTLSDLRNLLWFGNISPHNEPIFPFFGFGMLSIKQLGILGIGIMLAWGLWHKTGDYLSIIPAITALALVAKKENVVSTEMKIIEILIFHIKGRKNSKPTKKTPKKPILEPNKPESKLLIAKQYHAESNLVEKMQVRNIMYTYDKMFRMKIRLDKTEHEIADERVQIALDGVLYGTTRTDSNGEAIIHFIPEFPGKKLLQIYAHDNVLVYKEILNFTR